MKQLKTVLSVLILTLSALAWADSLKGGTSQPSADGTLASGEYSYLTEQAGMRLGLSLSADGKTLYVALEAPTKAWVSVGLGSPRMDGSYMVMGTMDKGAPRLYEELGKGHQHSASGEKRVLGWALVQAESKRTMEFAIPMAGLAGSGKLQLILAYGRGESISAIHAKFSRLTIDL